MEIHGKSMGNPWEILESQCCIPNEIHGKSMGNLGIPMLQASRDFSNYCCIPNEIHGKSMGNLGIPMKSMGNPWEIQGKSTEIQ